jgi:lysophospholipase L1-like esterase
MVFPYQLAQSNAPPDIVSSSNSSWEFNRVAHPEIPLKPGISGYTIKTVSSGASINIALKDDVVPQTFNNLKIFLGVGDSSSWILQAGDNNIPILLRKEDTDTSLCTEAHLERSTNSFSLSSIPSPDTKEFYGVSLENSGPGILYHTIGVNGVRYDQFNNATLFWKQLPSLNADLFIVSLGTNDAQGSSFDEKKFLQSVTLLIQKLKAASPNAAILITTTADSYKGRHSNIILRDVNLSLFSYCNSNHLPVWDLYRITNGFGSAYRWMSRGLMNTDRIHYTSAGYRVQGNLLFNALAKGYNNYVNSY